MSREIKFRAWHEGRKEWLHDGKPPGGGCNILGEIIWAFGEWCRVPIAELNDVVVEQFTGLKDRNGVDIYEGDILHMWAGDVGDTAMYNEIGTVQWNEEFAAFCVAHENGTTGVWSQYRNVVIGNVHQNADLLP